MQTKQYLNSKYTRHQRAASLDGPQSEGNEFKYLIMQAIKNTLSKFKNKLQAIGEWFREKYRNNRKKCRGTLLILAVLVLLTGLIAGSFKSVDSLSQGVPINYTSGTMINSTVNNTGSFLGLNTYYQTVPNTNFLISFQKAQPITADTRSFPSIKARVIEGILLEVETYAKVKISTNNLVIFFQQYGFEQVGGHESWLIYIKEKIRNAVVQQMATFKFYEVSNKALSAAINAQFTSYETNSALQFPFIVRIIGMNIHYPQQTLKSSNTLGIRLLEQQSVLSQFTNQLAQIKSYIQQYQSSMLAYAVKRADIDAKMANRENAVKLASAKWIQGVQTFNRAVNQNSTLLQKYLELYFSSLYNTTYRIESLQPFQI